MTQSPVHHATGADRMRGLIRLVEAATVPQHLYHVTSSTRITVIRRQGLVPQPCQDATCYGEIRRAIYLAADWQRAMEHAEVMLDRLGGAVVLLRIAGAALDPDALEPDDYDIQAHLPGGEFADPRLADYTNWRDVPWDLSLAVCGAVAYTKPIPPHALTRMVFR